MKLNLMKNYKWNLFLYFEGWQATLKRRNDPHLDTLIGLGLLN
jgi:hypothetical protein